MDKPQTVLEAINQALHRAMATDERVYLLGEDILDPYGGAFKAARGLSSTYPERVLTTPISEAGMLGVATGMALRGLRPVVEIMFGDFITLVCDQLVNHAVKFRWMYNEAVRVPLVVRTPMGGRRGYGPTHSQTLEKLFLGVPGLNVLAANTFTDPGELLYAAIMCGEDPLLFIENKLLYPLPLAKELLSAEVQIGWSEAGAPSLPFRAPASLATVRGAPPAQLTLAAYGHMAELARQAMFKLAYEQEAFVELVVPSRLAPVDASLILESARRTSRLLVIEEGTLTLGWGAEVLARAAEISGTPLKIARRLAAREHPIPSAPHLEAASLPSVEQIVAAASAIIRTEVHS
ncbi:MAG: transketolase C-terminal domain-containing protein [Anaerolineales bacterium]|nr:transketolase C-terminal domain-containing protein [Anaerolineales bacterium]